MSEDPVRTRFAPSPTGFMHLGNARTALFNALYAKKTGGTFLLRIEDTDPERCEERYQAALLEDLRWLGLPWDEGPEAGGMRGPYLQSERNELYAHYYDQLIERDLAYPCFCTEQMLKLSRKAQLAAGQPPRYAGTCARLRADEVKSRIEEGLKPTLRFRVSTGEVIEFNDLVRGTQRFRTDDIGDFIIRRADGTPAFFFGNAVDDALMGVSCVLRGEDHLANTPRQKLILRALNVPIPQYGHISLIVGADGRPLSKRHGAKSIAQLREQGYLPGALNNHLARLGHTYESDAFMSLDELVDQFSIERLGRAPARHDDRQLRYWQREAVARKSDEELVNWLREQWKDRDQAVDEVLSEFVKAVRDNIVMPADARSWAQRLFVEDLQISSDAKSIICEAGADLFATAARALEEGMQDFREFSKTVGEAANIKGKALFMPLRAALTGDVHGPEMARIFPLIGPARARKRLQVAQNLCRQSSAR